jgi:hypothetical protein
VLSYLSRYCSCLAPLRGQPRGRRAHRPATWARDSRDSLGTFAMREHYASVGPTGAVQIEGGAPSTSQAALPAGWEGCLDPVSNRVFYHHAATRTSQWNSPLGGRSARVVRPPREPYPQTFDSEEPDLLVLSYPRMADCSKPDLAESHDQWRGEPGGGSITAELLPLPNMNAPQQ